MIRCTIVETTSQPDEAATRVARATVSETLTLGRGAACKIYLPDPRVRLEHARIERAEDGYLYLEGIGGPVSVNGEPQEKVRVADGQHLVIGPFEFEVAKLVHGPDSPQILITLNFTHKPADPDATEAAPSASGLRHSWLSVRSLSWLAVVVAAVFLLTLPLWQAYQPIAQKGAAPESKLDVAWNPGPLSSAHQTMDNQCRKCHTVPFERVKDSACTACHKAIGPHITEHPDIEKQVFSEQRCATCHREHQGEDGMKKVAAVGCENCHSNVKAYAPSTRLPDVGDFGQKHPEFRVSMKVNASPSVKATVTRRDFTPELKESSGLKFPHDIHLAAKGVKSPNGTAASGGRVVMECSDCHQLDTAKLRYQPVSMEKNCSTCHRLSVDAQNPTRQVPHDQPKVVVQALRDMFSALALEQNPSQVVTVNSLLQGPQIKAPVATTTPALRWVDDKTQSTATNLLDNPKGPCQACHTIERVSTTGTTDKTLSWKVTPVLSNDHWLPKSLFSHAQHSNAPCASCHNAATSKSSSDILIPPIKTCRNCHTGTDARDVHITGKDKVVSQCNSCHGFHAPVVHATFVAAKAAVAASGVRHP